MLLYFRGNYDVLVFLKKDAKCFEPVKSIKIFDNTLFYSAVVKCYYMYLL